MTAVDIVVRTKNRPKFLARALEDILAQEFTDWHLIIVDNGDDPTETRALVDARGFSDRCTVLRQPDPVGVPALSNIGVSAGTAEFVTIHDDDDTWHPQFLTRTIAHLRATDDLAVAVRTEIVWETTSLQETGREVFHPQCWSPRNFDLLRFNPWSRSASCSAAAPTRTSARSTSAARSSTTGSST